MGINVLYSGTVSAATEAAIMGIKSIAVSLGTYREPDFGVAARFVGRLIPQVEQLELPEGVCININVPPLPENQIKGVLLTRQENGVLVEHYMGAASGKISTIGWQGLILNVNWSRALIFGLLKTAIFLLHPFTMI